MMFRKNKPASGPEESSHTMRGRDSEPGKRGANALARRFLVDDEPDTIDLAGPGEFPETTAETGADAEPDTWASAEEAPAAAFADSEGVISRDPATGKFYVHPGSPETPVLLAGEAVSAPTELRQGDRIRIGQAEFEFRGISEGI